MWYMLYKKPAQVFVLFLSGVMALVGSLQVLDLGDNDLEDWAEVEKLASWPCLQYLQLGNNRLSNIHYPTAEGTCLKLSIIGVTAVKPNADKSSIHRIFFGLVLVEFAKTQAL